MHVAIEIARPSTDWVAPHELEAALVRACTTAVRDGDCSLEHARPDLQRSAVAIVRWDVNERSVFIDFSLPIDGGNRPMTRSLTFDEADERAERWRTVGLTIATLAGEAELANDRAETTKAREPAEAKADSAPRAKQTSRTVQASKLWLDVGGLVGTALDTASPRIGVWADVGARLGQSPFIALAGLDYAVARGEPFLSVQWLGAAIGLGAQVGASDRGLMFEGSALFSVERQQVSASDGGRADSDAVFGYGGRVRTGLVWKLGVFSPVLGAQGWVNAAPVKVLVHDQYAGAAPRAGGAILLGVRARLD
jgi:hypothetical protein